MTDDLGHYMEAVSRYREALLTIAGSDPNGMEGFHFVGDEDKPEECPGCVARAALDAQRQSMLPPAQGAEQRPETEAGA